MKVGCNRFIAQECMGCTCQQPSLSKSRITWGHLLGPFKLVYYAASPLRGGVTPRSLSVRPSVCMPTVNSKTEIHTTFKLRGEVSHVRSNWQSNFDVKDKRSRSLGRKKGGPHIVSAIGAALLIDIEQYVLFLILVKTIATARDISPCLLQCEFFFCFCFSKYEIFWIKPCHNNAVSMFLIHYYVVFNRIPLMRLAGLVGHSS